MELLERKIIEGIQNKKGRRIVVADLSGIQDTITRKFIICEGGSPTQVQAIVESIGEECRKVKAKPITVDGLRNSVWVAMDYVDIIVHVFLPDERSYYDLEHLWADARLTEIPDLD
ncbi:MAG: ribosome silencing factor [Bacteroidaceae bacterium]|nr:ribosome silencing factor [Bacteroidaceae bacterium]